MSRVFTFILRFFKKLANGFMKNPLQVLCRTNTAELSHLRDIVLGKLDNAALFKSRRSVVIIVNADNERDRLI